MAGGGAGPRPVKIMERQARRGLAARRKQHQVAVGRALVEELPTQPWLRSGGGSAWCDASTMPAEGDEMSKAALALMALALSACVQAPVAQCPPGTTYMRAFRTCMALPGAKNVEPGR